MNRKRIVCLLAVSVACTTSAAQSDFDFWISKGLLADIDAQGIVYTATGMQLTAAARVHALKQDCEAHIAGQPASAVAAAPHMYVIEPPNLCKHKPPSGFGSNWKKYFDERLLGKTCNVTGFPRIFDEHLRGDETPTNPHHMLEIHPALKIECGNEVLDASAFMRHYPGMREISAASALKCFDTEVQVRDNSSEDRWEFQVKRNKSCGNFASFEMSIFTDWIRALKGGSGGHSAIARVKPGSSEESTTLKIYTLPGTAEDTQLEQWRTSGEPHHGAWLHGMTTIDYFSIIKAIRNPDGTSRDVSQWTEVEYPLALVIFGTVADPDPEEDEGESLHD